MRIILRLLSALVALAGVTILLYPFLAYPNGRIALVIGVALALVVGITMFAAWYALPPSWRDRMGI